MSTSTIVVASRIYAPEPSAASLRLASLTAELVERGNEVRVLTTRPPRGTAPETDDRRGARVSRWPVLRDRAGYVRGYLQYLSFDVPLFFRVLFGGGAEVYVCEPPPTSALSLRLALLLRRRPYVYYAADIWSDASAATSAPSFVVAVVRGMERLVLRRAARVLVVSPGVERRVGELAPTADVAVVGHGVDLGLFSAVGEVDPDGADVVYVGSASEWHGAEIAVDALAQVMRERPGLTAAFVGQGSSWERLQEKVREQGLAARIAFRSTVSPEEAATVLRSARLSLATLVPGKGYDFAVPTKLYSSIAVGTRVVYAGPDPVRSLIRDNGLGVATDYDAAAYADGIREALREAEAAPVDGLTRWAAEHLSATAVARRAADAILGAARARRKR